MQIGLVTGERKSFLSEKNYQVEGVDEPLE